MSKAILVLNEMPESCIKCYAIKASHGMIYCEVMQKGTNKDAVYKSRPDFCPLKPMPEKDVYSSRYDEYLSGYNDGWNNCLREIGGLDE